jgi:hypothetical protein
MSRRPLPKPALAGLLALTVTLTGCDRGTPPSGKAFCDRVAARLTELKGPVTDSATARASVAAYRDVLVVAPAPVRDAWRAVTELVEAAATLDLTSPSQQSAFAERAVAADRDIRTVVTYADDTCGIMLSPAG